MRELAKRLGLSATHLTLIDQFVAETFDEYARMRQKLVRIPGYTMLAEQLYNGQEQRQMMLGDILLYMLTGRGFWTAVRDVDGFKQFVSILMYIANLLLIQETLLSARPDERQEFLRRLEGAGLEHFFASGAERDAYRELMAFGQRITVREPRPLYKVMDSVLPRTPGIVIELLVYVHLLVRKLGYSVPLLILQDFFVGTRRLRYLIIFFSARKETFSASRSAAGWGNSTSRRARWNRLTASLKIRLFPFSL
jgi:hypothetical protein